jgi:hypothetical protein
MATRSSATAEPEKSSFFGAPIPASKCTSRPACSCEFCIQTRAELPEECSERDAQDRLACEFIDAYCDSRTSIRGHVGVFPLPRPEAVT